MYKFIKVGNNNINSSMQLGVVGLSAFLSYFVFVSMLQVCVFTRSRGIFCQLCDRGSLSGLWDGVVAVARVAALHHSFDAGSFCCRKKICQTGLY